MQLPEKTKPIAPPRQSGWKTSIALKISLLYVAAAGAASFFTLAYLEMGIKRSIANQHYSLAQESILQNGIYLVLGICAATLVVLVLVWPLIRGDTSRLSQDEERFRTLVESSPDAILLHRNGVFIYVNNAALSLVGAERADQLIGHPVESVVPPEFKSLIREGDEQIQSVVGHANPRHEEKVRRLDGRAIDVEAATTPLSYQGEPAVQVILRDITARKAAEAALRESEETLRNLMEAMPVGVGLVEDDGSISYLNRCFEEHFGYSHRDLPDLDTWYQLAYPNPLYRKELVATINANLAQAHADKTPVAPTEVDITCKDGSVRHIIINRQRAGNRRMVIFTDITERETMQNEILKSQKLESLGVLAGGIAHDFNNILTGILGNITLAQMFLDQVHPASEPLACAERAATRAGELATQLLTFAKGGAPVKKVIALGALIEEAATLALRGANVSGNIRIPAGLHSIEADEGQLSQVFHNIVFNAVQAMPGGGTLIVSAENVTLASGNKPALPPGDYVRITFADQGHGIPDEILNKIFDPYFTTKPGGTGLGLASVHSIVRKHGGHVEVRSLVGRGTDFTFLLPSLGVVTVTPEAAQVATEPGDHAGEAVLVMDDDKLIQTLVSQILQHLGYRVTTCADGEEAIALYERGARSGNPFLAAIMDLTIPGGMGGKEAAQRLLALDPAARLIVSSGYSNDPVMADFGRYGFCAAIAKPYRVAELAGVLARLKGTPGSTG